MLELFNGKGSLVEGCIERIDRTGLDFVALEDPTLVPPLSTQWHVFAAFGTLKGDRADWLVEKCTELGAHSVTPLLTERSPSISENRVDRLRRVILAATKQSQRLHEMILNPPAKIVGLLPLLAQSKLSFLAAAGAPPVVSVLTSSRKRIKWIDDSGTRRGLHGERSEYDDESWRISCWSWTTSPPC
ncbi:hypothetical protein OIU77_016668 [Salix suchowensis]|uniref:16S rRNA (uracil(1498)-N(3))-methyltransferase n=1 Tax=Salix suchowensis TaxID=1278906 RepID=A0ABQ8ZL58_9ROSI|nr:hypothetical protein OIU77_016668 [Salix suchowensis]